MVSWLAAGLGPSWGQQYCTRSLSNNEFVLRLFSTEDRLMYLFDMELQYRKAMSAVTHSADKLGKYIGSGEGTVEGLP